MKIVAFGHRRRVGKNLASDFLYSSIKAKEPKIKIFKGGFADAVKEHAFNMFSWAGLHPSYYYENNPGSKEEIIPALGISARDIWIHVGEEMRKICPTLWVELFFERVPADTDICIIYDLRKLPEALDVLKKGGKCYRIVRNVPEFSDPVDSELVNFTDWAGNIHNDGHMKDLMAAMNHFAEKLLG